MRLVTPALSLILIISVVNGAKSQSSATASAKPSAKASAKPRAKASPKPSPTVPATPSPTVSTTPSPTASAAPVDEKTSQEILEMENKLRVAMEARDIAALGKIMADHYFNSYEGAKRAMSKPTTIASIKAGSHNFLVIEKEQQLRGELDAVIVEGVARFRPNKVDDTTPEEQWARVRRMWEKKDGQWLLTGQFWRVIN